MTEPPTRGLLMTRGMFSAEQVNLLQVPRSIHHCSEIGA